MNRRIAVALASSFLFSSVVFAQGNPQQNGQTNPQGGFGANRQQTTTGPRPFNEVITSKAKTNKGLLTVHRLEDKYFFEIPDSLLNREILVVNRISKAPAGARAGFLGYAGDEISENVITFEKGPSNKIFLRSISYSEQGRDSAGMYQSVRNSNLQPINAAFPVAAYHTDSVSNAKSTVVDVTEYLMGDNDILFFDSRVKRQLGLTAYQRETSYLIDAQTFPTNLEIQTAKTYMRTPPALPGTITLS
ncbi:MAG: DUF5117 domain-containing protein, partial [Flavisolibacter sp.]